MNNCSHFLHPPVNEPLMPFKTIVFTCLVNPILSHRLTCLAQVFVISSSHQEPTCCQIQWSIFNPHFARPLTTIWHGSSFSSLVTCSSLDFLNTTFSWFSSYHTGLLCRFFLFFQNLFIHILMPSSLVLALSSFLSTFTPSVNVGSLMTLSTKHIPTTHRILSQLRALVSTPGSYIQLLDTSIQHLQNWIPDVLF